jgi:hypothetical protein
VAKTTLQRVSLPTFLLTIVMGLAFPPAGAPPRAGGQAPVFDFCLQDERSGDHLRFAIATGNYQFTHCGPGGFVYSGRGQISRVMGYILLNDSAYPKPNVMSTPFGSQSLVLYPIPRGAFARVTENATSSSTRKGFALVRPIFKGTHFMVSDDNIENNTCRCPEQEQGGGSQRSQRGLGDPSAPRPMRPR